MPAKRGGRIRGEPDEITIICRRIELHLRKGEHSIALEILTAAPRVARSKRRDPRTTAESSSDRDAADAQGGAFSGRGIV